MPDWTHDIRRRLAPLRLPPSRERSIVDELAQHVEDHYRDLRDAGMAAAEAEAAVLAGLDRHDLFRQLTLAKESKESTMTSAAAHEQFPKRNIAGMLAQDLLYATRLLRRNIGLTAIA